MKSSTMLLIGGGAVGAFLLLRKKPNGVEGVEGVEGVGAGARGRPTGLKLAAGGPVKVPPLPGVSDLWLRAGAGTPDPPRAPGDPPRAPGDPTRASPPEGPPVEIDSLIIADQPSKIKVELATGRSAISVWGVVKIREWKRPERNTNEPQVLYQARVSVSAQAAREGKSWAFGDVCLEVGYVGKAGGSGPGDIPTTNIDNDSCNTVPGVPRLTVTKKKGTRKLYLVIPKQMGLGLMGRILWIEVLAQVKSVV